MTNEERSKLKQQLSQAVVNKNVSEIQRIKKILKGEIRVLRTFLDFLMATDAEGDEKDKTEFMVDPDGDFPQFIQETENNK